MENKEMIIVPPDGYVLDRENSTFERIVFRPIQKPKRWRDDESAMIGGYAINEIYSRVFPISEISNQLQNYCVFATEKQANAALAMARISQIMYNDKRFGGVITDGEWNSTASSKYTIERYGDEVIIQSACNTYHFLAFHTSKQRDLFLEENRDLINEYFMID